MVGYNLLEAGVQPLSVLVEDHCVRVPVQLLETQAGIIFPLDFLRTKFKILIWQNYRNKYRKKAHLLDEKLCPGGLKSPKAPVRISRRQRLSTGKEGIRAGGGGRRCAAERSQGTKT